MTLLSSSSTDPAGAPTGTGSPLDPARFFRSNVLVYTHIEKTGGSFFVVGTKKIFGDERVYDIRGGHPRPFEMEPKDLAKTWLLSGHFWFDTQERPIARRKHHLMSIRDPVDRFLSYYNYVAAARDHPGHNKYGVLDISDAFEWLKKNNPNAVFNRFCAMFGERKPSKRPREPGRVLRARSQITFEQAKQKIEQHYALVIPMRRLDDAMVGMAQTFGISYVPIGRVNVASAKKAESVPEHVRQELIRGNVEDYKLLEYYTSVFDERLQQLGSRLLNGPVADLPDASSEGVRPRPGLKRMISRLTQ